MLYLFDSSNNRFRVTRPKYQIQLIFKLLHRLTDLSNKKISRIFYFYFSFCLHLYITTVSSFFESYFTMYQIAISSYSRRPGAAQFQYLLIWHHLKFRNVVKTKMIELLVDGISHSRIITCFTSSECFLVINVDINFTWSSPNT